MNWFKKIFCNCVEVESPKVEPERPSKVDIGKRLKWHPDAEIVSPGMKTRGKYRKGWPEGAIIHFTAGRNDGRGMINWGREQGYAYLCIDESGKIFQGHAMDEWGYHAGESAWPGLGEGVSDKLIGIEVCAAGRVEKMDDGNFKTWFGTIVGPDRVRYSPTNDNILGGYYYAFTEAQEKALCDVLIWLYQQDPEVFNLDLILGHDEVAGPKGIGRWRKNDPGAALSMTMTEFRKKIKDLALNRKA